MSWFELIADRKIRDAMEDGRFDDLPGKGKPLNLDVNLSVPPEQRMAVRLMREANFLPDWIQLDKEIRERQERIRTKTEAYAQRRQADRAGDTPAAVRLLDGRRDDFLIYAVKELRDLNRAIDRFNLIVPALSRQRLRLKLSVHLSELEERFPRLHPLLGDTMPWRELIHEERPPTRLATACRSAGGRELRLMAAPEAGAHRRSPRWQRALEIAEAAVRLAPTEPSHRLIAVQLADAAGKVPAAAAHVEHGEPAKFLDQALLKLEATVVLAQRLGAIPEAKASAVVARIDAFRSPTSAPAATAVAPLPRETPKPVERPAPKPAATRLTPKPAQPAPAPERLLVDGSNFLGRAPGYALGDEGSRDRLAFRLQDYVRRHPAHRYRFFDGQKTSSRNLGGVEERVTSGLHEADDVIVELCPRPPPPRTAAGASSLRTTVPWPRAFGARA